MAPARPPDPFRAAASSSARPAIPPAPSRCLRSALHAFLFASALIVCGACVSARGTQDSNRVADAPCREVQPPATQRPAWWSPDDRRMRAELLRWCDTVGPVVAHLTPAAATRRSDRLAIISWNLHVGAADVGRLVAQLKAGAFTGGAPIEEFVLLLQEAYRRDEAIPVRLPRGLPVPSRIADERHRGPDVDRFWRQDGYAVLYAPSMRNGMIDVRREDRGNAIVSTIPLEDPVLIELPLERQRRVAVVSTVAGMTRAGAPWRVRLVDVHLDTALAMTRGGPFAARLRQAHALIAALRATAAVDDAAATTLVGGDFNTWGGHERAIDALADAFPDAHDSGRDPTWGGPLGLHATLDHVFASGRFRVEVRRLPDRFGSDHYPLLAVVTF